MIMESRMMVGSLRSEISRYRNTSATNTYSAVTAAASLITRKPEKIPPSTTSGSGSSQRASQSASTNSRKSNACRGTSVPRVAHTQ